MLSRIPQVGSRNCIILMTKGHGLQFTVVELDELAATDLELTDFELDLVSGEGGSSPDFSGEVAQTVEASVTSLCSISGGYQALHRLFERHP